MIVLLSPAKTLDYSDTPVEAQDVPKFRKRTFELIQILKQKTPKDLMELMHISEKLADENYQRYQKFSKNYTTYNSKAALLAFKGDVYLGLEANTLDTKDMLYAQDHIRILSGLYGVLKPLDKMQPYRLEMGTSLENAFGGNLYKFWGDDITKAINRDLGKQKSKLVVNLASNEYFNAVDRKKIKAPILDIQFKEYKNGKLMFVSFTAKKARGLMARYIVTNRIENKEDVKSFNLEDYYFDAALSKENSYTFVR